MKLSKIDFLNLILKEINNSLGWQILRYLFRLQAGIIFILSSKKRLFLKKSSILKYRIEKNSLSRKINKTSYWGRNREKEKQSYKDKEWLSKNWGSKCRSNREKSRLREEQSRHWKSTWDSSNKPRCARSNKERQENNWWQEEDLTYLN